MRGYGFETWAIVLSNTFGNTKRPQLTVAYIKPLPEDRTGDFNHVILERTQGDPVPSQSRYIVLHETVRSIDAELIAEKFSGLIGPARVVEITDKVKQYLGIRKQNE